jgi:hypothetical protein
MATLISTPARIPVPGGKVIYEHVGLVATGDGHISVARMIAPPGWIEPAQTPDFDEITLVLAGELIAFDIPLGTMARSMLPSALLLSPPN